MKKIVTILPILALLSAGCAIQAHYFQNGANTTLTPVLASAVKIYSSQTPTDSGAQVLGSVAVDVVGDGATALQSLQEEAGAMGANAVYEVKLTKINTYAQRTGISGVAVRNSVLSVMPDTAKAHFNPKPVTARAGRNN